MIHLVASRHALVAWAPASNSKGAFRYPCAAICWMYRLRNIAAERDAVTLGDL
jgi:hypothetical protein